MDMTKDAGPKKARTAEASKAERGAPLYNRDILRLAATISHLGKLSAPHGSAEKRSVTCGSKVVADVCVNNDGSLSELGLEVSACALGQASASILSANAVGKQLSEIEAAYDQLSAFLSGRSEEIGTWEHFDKLVAARPFTARHPSIKLPFEALISSIKTATSHSGKGQE